MSNPMQRVLRSSTALVAPSRALALVLARSLSMPGLLTLTSSIVLGLSAGTNPAAAQDAFIDGGLAVTVPSGPQPSPWLINGTLVVGSNSTGTLSVEAGGQVGGINGYIGFGAASHGMATVTGPGSRWANSSVLLVGVDGSGGLTVANGGQVQDVHGYIGYNAGSRGMATVTGPGSLWTHSGDMLVGYGGEGALTVANGGQVQNALGFLGYHAGSRGTATVTGPGSLWANSGDMYLGVSGEGALTVANGGQVRNAYGLLGYFAGAAGTMTVTGAGSLWANSLGIAVGESGTGVLTIADGGRVESGGTGSAIGDLAGSVGTATVTGANSIWTNTSIFIIGYRGTGTLLVADGGSIESRRSYIGGLGSGSGSVTVSGAGSVWTVINEDLLVGLEGRGALTISAGGRVQNSWASIGTVGGSVGSVLVSGSNSIWQNSRRVTVGESGAGSLTAIAGGLVSAEGFLVAANAGSVGTLNIGAAATDAAAAAGTLQGAGLLFGNGNGRLVFNHTDGHYDFSLPISGPGRIDHLAGKTHLTGDSSGFSGTTTVSGGTLGIDGRLGGLVVLGSGGRLQGNGTITGNLSANGGTLAPGNSIGTLTINGNLVLGAGSLYLAELQGPVTDRINVGGTASLAGTLRLAQLGGAYLFAAPYTLLSAAGGLGGTTFGSVDTAGSFGDGITSSIAYTGTEVLLTLAPKPLLPIVTPSPGGSPTRNAASVASGIDAAVAAGADPSLLFAIYNLPAAAIPAAVNQLSGEVHTAAPAMANSAAGQFLRTMLDGSGAGRLAGPQNGPGGAAGFTADLPSRQDGPGRASFDPGRFSLWGATFGSTERNDGDRGAGSANRNFADGHVAVGADIRLGSNTVAGVAVTGGQSRASLSGGLGKAEADVFQAGLYGRTTLGTVNLAAALGYARLDTDTTRAIPALSRSGVTASYATQAWSGRIEASLPVATWHGLTLSPLAAFQAVRAASPAGIERDGMGATAGMLTLARRTDMTSRSELGLQLDTKLIAGATPVTGFVRAAWAHYYQRDAELAASLNGLPGASFTATGARPDRNAALLAAGADIKLSQSVSLGMRVDSELSASTRRVGGTAQLRVSF